MPAEFDVKPCTVPGCPGVMMFSLRVVPVRRQARGVVHPRPGWLCDEDLTHIEWGSGEPNENTGA